MLIRIGVALKKLHDKGIIHRNLTLENIEVDRITKGYKHSYIPYLGDTSKMIYQDEIGYQDDWDDLIYRAPEMIENKEYDEKVDIYALGIVFYAFLANKMPREFIYSIDNYKTKEFFMTRNSIKPHQKLFGLIKWMLAE